jgi:hypothetical protein
VPGYHDLASPNNQANSLIPFSIDRVPAEIKLLYKKDRSHDWKVIRTGHHGLRLERREEKAVMKTEAKRHGCRRAPR